VTLDGGPWSGPFIGPDDFLSPSSVGVGCLGRRVSADAALRPSFTSSGGGAAEDMRDLGARRSTVSEMTGRGGGAYSSTGGVSAAVEDSLAKETEAFEGGASDVGVQDMATDAVACVKPSPSTEDAVAKEPPPGAAPALLVRKVGEGAGGAAAVVDTTAAVAAGQVGDGGSNSSIRVAEAGNIAAKSSDGGNVGGPSDSAATSFVGGEGGVRSPSRGAGAGGVVPAPRATAAGGGGCCVVS